HHLERALELRTAHLGPNDPATLSTRDKVVAILVDQGKLERLVQLYDDWGRKDKADEWRKKLEAAKAPPQPPPKPCTAPKSGNARRPVYFRAARHPPAGASTGTGTSSATTRNKSWTSTLPRRRSGPTRNLRRCSRCEIGPPTRNPAMTTNDPIG